MITTENFHILLIAIIAMAILTALSRLLPFLLSDKSKVMRFFMQENSPIAPLGGAIIGSMTVILALPLLKDIAHINQALPFIIGSIVTIIATIKNINTGLSVLIGMAGYLCTKLIL